MKATIINGSSSRTNIAVWGVLKNDGGAEPVAWISPLLSPATYACYEWDLDYQYIWANTGALVSGKMVYAAQRVDASASPVCLTRDGDAGYSLVPYKPPVDPPPGKLLIETAGDIPLGQLAVGINLRIASGPGQPGSGVSVLQAQPNLVYTWDTGMAYFANFGAIPQSEYDPGLFKTQKKLVHDLSGDPDAVIMLDESNVLKQLKNSQAEEILSAGSFIEVPTDVGACGTSHFTANT